MGNVRGPVALGQENVSEGSPTAAVGSSGVGVTFSAETTSMDSKGTREMNPAGPNRTRPQPDGTEDAATPPSNPIHQLHLGDHAPHATPERLTAVALVRPSVVSPDTFMNPYLLKIPL
ncbi:hypothetical protein EYF80_059018 [Liparis tanakae]|uniref:Uncharacterized protein n=1 Tax=Liparis tanakae TaxID=230148 RepID=A0A4Z2EQE3_9TELE|nr:hypothetical protein EYF80_059018 [Liparis tanakae]